MPKSEIVINRPADAVFAHVGDLTHHGEWATHNLVVEAMTEGEPAVGARYRSRGRQLGQEMQDQLTVTAFEPPRRIVFESAGRSGVWRHTLEVTPIDAARTRVTKHMDPVRLPLLANLARPGIALGLPKRLHKDLELMRARLEQVLPA